MKIKRKPPNPPITYPANGYSHVLRANASKGTIFPRGRIVVNWRSARMACIMIPHEFSHLTDMGFGEARD
jgi:hypothetical protein